MYWCHSLIGAMNLLIHAGSPFFGWLLRGEKSLIIIKMIPQDHTSNLPSSEMQFLCWKGCFEKGVMSPSTKVQLSVFQIIV
jgi:hypothetical protein